MKRVPAEPDTAAWHELLSNRGVAPRSIEDGTGLRIGTEMSPERESLSPNTTVTTETGKQLLYRLKSSPGYSSRGSKQMSWTSSNRFSPKDPHGTVTSGQKFSMKQTTIFPARVKRRVVLKNGNINLSKERVEKRHQRYLQDTFTTMVDIQWRWNLLVFAMGFILSWLGFALIWWVICLAHGDFDHIGDDKWTPWLVSISVDPEV